MLCTLLNSHVFMFEIDPAKNYCLQVKDKPKQTPSLINVCRCVYGYKYTGANALTKD